MKISQVVLKKVNNFEGFSYSFEDSWTKTIPASLLLMGPNGCGKTTILRSIVDLWDFLGIFLDQGEVHLDRTSGLAGCQLAAVLIENLLSKPVWVYIGNKKRVDDFLDRQNNSYAIGWIWKSKGNSLEYQPYLFLNGSGRKTTELPDWVEELNKRFIENSLGSRSDLPNLIFLDSEHRTLPKIEKRFSVIPEKENFNWLARYTAPTRRKGSIENYLFTLKVVDEESYDRIVTGANRFLVDKQINGFDPTSKELMIKTESGQNHPAYLLSSGEKQILLMIAHITRWLRPGGLVLIDEPDLHLHVSLSNAFVSYLKQMVTDQNGQLIIASHAPELWDHFTQAERIELGPVVGVQA